MSRDGCSGKKRHRTREIACIVVKRLKNCAMNVYWCPKCKGWHVGHSRDPYRMAQRVDQILAQHERALQARLSPSNTGAEG